MKLPFPYVAKEVDLLYEKQIDPKDVEDHCDFIGAFIRACGWDEWELIKKMYPDSNVDAMLSEQELNSLN